MAPLYKKLHWTEHSKIKMKQYGLSKSKLISILHKPERKEQGIVPGTVAVMRTNKTFFKEKKVSLAKAWQKPKKAAGEVWMMFKELNNERKVISAWRYPGVSKPGEEIPIPKDVLCEVMKMAGDDFA